MPALKRRSKPCRHNSNKHLTHQLLLLSRCTPSRSSSCTPKCRLWLPREWSLSRQCLWWPQESKWSQELLLSMEWKHLVLVELLQWDLQWLRDRWHMAHMQEGLEVQWCTNLNNRDLRSTINNKSERMWWCLKDHKWWQWILHTVNNNLHTTNNKECDWLLTFSNQERLDVRNKQSLPFEFSWLNYKKI